jgi:hypothetical protein
VCSSTAQVSDSIEALAWADGQQQRFEDLLLRDLPHLLLLKGHTVTDPAQSDFWAVSSTFASLECSVIDHFKIFMLAFSKSKGIHKAIKVLASPCTSIASTQLEGFQYFENNMVSHGLIGAII